jgi:hypothetical protein
MERGAEDRFSGIKAIAVEVIFAPFMRHNPINLHGISGLIR